IGPVKAGGDIDIDLGQGHLELQSGGQIRVEAPTDAPGGEIRIHSGSIRIDSTGSTGTSRLSQIATTSSNYAVGGDIFIETGHLEVVDGGHIETVSGGALKGGDVRITADRIDVAGEVPGISNAIIASLTNGTSLPHDPAAKKSGDITILTRTLRLGANGFIFSDMDDVASGRGGDVSITATDEIGIDLDPDVAEISVISASVCGFGTRCRSGFTGRGGNLFVEAGRINMRGAADIEASTNGFGESGNITVVVHESLDLIDGASIRAVAIADRDAGDISVKASGARVRIAGFRFATSELFPDPQPSGILAQGQTSGGSSGNVEVNADTLVLENGGKILANTFGAGRAGNVTIQARDITMHGINERAAGMITESGEPVDAASGVRVDTADLPGDVVTGSAGTLLIKGFDHLRLEAGAKLIASSETRGDAGQVILQGHDITLRDTRGVRDGLRSGIRADHAARLDTGADPGGVFISATGTFTNVNGLITTRGLDVEGGVVDISARNVLLGPSSNISSTSSGAGDAGRIAIRAADRLMLAGGDISTLAQTADGGDVELASGGSLVVLDGLVSAEALIGNGTGGNVSMRAPAVYLRDSTVTADAAGGPGGNIQVTAGYYLGRNSELTASSEKNVDGFVTINSPDIDVSNSLAPLPSELFQAPELAHEPCAAREDEERSSLVASGPERLPPAPEGALPASSLPAVAGSSSDGSDGAPVRGGPRLAVFSLRASCAHR
ncbi:MAG: S-layer family protein, partial [Deltaproteobacteria bacterium]|nr:S-layer family protein [Deltaproteobacteria bacterium]